MKFLVLAGKLLTKKKEYIYIYAPIRVHIKTTNEATSQPPNFQGTPLPGQ